jgi:hypothetical protein
MMGSCSLTQSRECRQSCMFLAAFVCLEVYARPLLILRSPRSRHRRARTWQGRRDLRRLPARRDWRRRWYGALAFEKADWGSTINGTDLYARVTRLIRASAWSTVRIPQWTQGAMGDTVGKHELVAAQQIDVVIPQRGKAGDVLIIDHQSLFPHLR